MWLLWLVFVSSTAAKFIPPNERCVTAAYTAYNYLTFAGPPASVWLSRCHNPVEVTSIYAATDVHCPPDEVAPGIAQLSSFCRQFAQTDLVPRHQVAANLTEDAIEHMRVVEYGEIPRREPVEEALLISPAYFERTFRTVDDLQYVSWKHRLYGYACYGYWAGILSIGTLHQLSSHLWKNRRVSRQPGMSSQGLYHLIQTHLIVPVPRRFLCWTFPTRLDAIILGLFWTLNTVLSCVSYPTFEGNL